MSEVAAPKVASMGKTSRSDFSMGIAPEESSVQSIGETGVANDVAVTGDKTNLAVGDEGVSSGATEVIKEKVQPSFTEDQKKEYFKSIGIDYEGDEQIKEKFTKQSQAPATETDEQKQEKAKLKDKRKLDLFISNGGTVEQFVAIKNFAEADLSQLSANTLKMELSDAGFDDAQIEEIIQERYYQTPDDVIDLLGDESQKTLAKKKKELFTNKLTNRSAHIKSQAAAALSTLEQAIETEDLMKQREQETLSNIDEQFKKLPRKSTFEIGEINGIAISPIESEVPESEITEVRDMMKDPAKRNQFLYNQDGSVNITNITGVLAENKILKSALKVAYHEAGNRQVAIFEKTFPGRSAYEVGVGGSKAAANNTGTKTPASFGKTTRTQQSTN